jgi:hypothetical protein
MSKLILGAIEDSYEDQLDAIAGERALARDLADPSGSMSWNEFSARIKARIAAKNGRTAAKSSNGKRQSTRSRSKKTKVGVRS